jgi:hypothetical protein
VYLHRKGDSSGSTVAPSLRCSNEDWDFGRQVAKLDCTDIPSAEDET